MRFVVNIDKHELNEFVRTHDYAHYMKTSFWAEYKSMTERYLPTYVGIYDNDKLVGTAILLKKRPWQIMKPYIYIPTGFCVDYSNRDHLDFLLSSVIAYAKTQKVMFIKIDPNVLRCHRTIDGEMINDGFNNEWLTEYLIDQGFSHKGYGYAYNGSWLNRYTLVIDMAKPLSEIVTNFNRSKQNVLKRHELIGVRSRVGKKEEIKYLVDFEWELTKTQGFKPHDITFFDTLLASLGENGHFYVTEVDLKRHITNLESELSSNKYRKDPEAYQAKQTELKKVSDLLRDHGAKVIIAAGIFVHYANWSWDLYTYNRKAFSMYKATDNLHLFAIQDMKERGITNYDMVGFSGVTVKSDPYFGLYDYKRSFGSTFYEHIGEFDYVFDNKAYRIFKYILFQTKRIRRKWFSVRYKKIES